MNDLSTKVVDRRANYMANMEKWREECESDKNPQVNNSFQLQLYNLLYDMHNVVDGMPPLTYDLMRDPNYTSETQFVSKGARSERTSIWYALAYYLNPDEAGAVRHRSAAALEKMVQRGIYNLKSQALGTSPALFVVPSKSGGGDICAITFNPYHKVESGEFAKDVSGVKLSARAENAVSAYLMHQDPEMDAATAGTIAADIMQTGTEQATLGAAERPRLEDS